MGVELPTGSVTLLFSDMEGSTQLLDRLGDEYIEVLRSQRAVLRAAWVEHDGIELGMEGDSFFVAFSSARDGVAAAVTGQRQLGKLDLAESDRPRVRMGLHTGSPVPHDGGYVGMDVHRGARMASAAHGGQIVISAATAELVRNVSELGVSFIELGAHRLKDIPEAEVLFQVTADGLRRTFPPLRSLGTTTGLPAARTPLVGRDGELARLGDMIASKRARLVTLTGPGGTGKTRLATALAERTAAGFAGGVFFVSLVTATSRHAMWTMIAEALDLPAEGKAPPGFFDHVAHRKALLVLDNLEQIEGADTVVSELLEQAPAVVVVATSRVPMHLRGEYEHPVPPLELPAPSHTHEPAEVVMASAVQLFVQQASMVKPSFELTVDNAEAVAEICRRLDGLPLALELAAARVKLVSPSALVKRLDQSLDLASPGVDRHSRQRRLRDTIAWSYELLPPDHQRFLNTLGVFVGGADLETIEALTAHLDLAGEDGVDVFEAVAALADASLLTMRESEDGEPWIVLLETIRAFALEQLQLTGQLDRVQRCHAEVYRDRALHHREQHLDIATGTPGASSADLVPRAWRSAHADNLRAALAWSLAQPTPDLERRRIALPLVAFSASIFADGYLEEGLDWARTAVDAAGYDEGWDVVGCLMTASDFARRLGRWEEAISYSRRAATQSARLDDRYLEANSLRALATVLASAGDMHEARVHAEAAARLAEQVHAVGLRMDTLHVLALLEAREGNLERSLSLDREALALAVELKDLEVELYSRQNIACSLRELGRPREAFDELAAICGDVIGMQETDRLCVYGEDLACVLSDLDFHAQTARLIGAVDALRERTRIVRTQYQEEDVQGPFARARSAAGDAWEALYGAGARTSIGDVISEAIASVHEV